jgi:hypothetical protein
MKVVSPRIRAIALLLLSFNIGFAAFRDDFDKPISKDPSFQTGWNWVTGDGSAGMDVTSSDGQAHMSVNGSTDRRGIWWAIFKRNVTPSLDTKLLLQPGHELRIEARVRTPNAPKRVNLSFNTPQTTDFHSNLMEYDLAEPNKWYTISLTTHGWSARPGDEIFAQLAMIDWGLGQYLVDIDYITVDVVDPKKSGLDVGPAVPYRPAVADPHSFKNVITATENAVIDRRETDANLKGWSSLEVSEPTPVLTVNGTQLIVMRWDLQAFSGKKAKGSGLLELATHSVQASTQRIKDFGLLRVVEILGGEEHWVQETVTYNSLTGGKPYEDVFNTQMIIDIEVSTTRGGRNYVTISNPVMQRLIDGRTKGILLIPLGSISASFYGNRPEDHSGGPKLLFNVVE